MKASLLLSIIFGVIAVNIMAREIGDAPPANDPPAPKVFDAKEMPLMTEPKINSSERKSCKFFIPNSYLLSCTGLKL